MKKEGNDMPKTKNPNNIAGISDDAVKKATGKSWSQWCTLLDKAGCKKLNHKEIVEVVHGKFGVGPWWQQMVTVGYEQARGLREKHQRAGGYGINRSKTIAAPLRVLYKAWQDGKTRAKWLKDHSITIRKAVANKSMRITWVDGRTNIETLFYPKGPGKSMVAVEHSKLPDAKTGQRMKAYWGSALERLQKLVEA